MAKKIKRVYVAGLLTPRGIKSASPLIEYLLNVRDLTRVATCLLLKGLDPFCPALDFLYFIVLRDDERITEPMIKRFSRSWLGVSDAMLLTEGWQKSEGTLKEIEFAKERGIPIYDSMERLLDDVEKE
jgi:hypothetical protein